jgi:D-glycero-alpha-D-manno-heptose 1-phosphate guanylyltransferase
MKAEAVILAGGFGTRLKGVIEDIPKPMADVGGKPFLSYLLEQLVNFGCKKVIIAAGYKYKAIIDFYGDQYKSLRIEYVIESIPLGTGGAILGAANSITAPGFIVLNGDSYMDLNLDEFENKSLESKSPVSIALKKMVNFDRYGTVTPMGNGIISFREKAQCKEGLINSGIYYIDKEWYKKHAPGEIFSFEKDILEKYVSDEKISGFEFNGYFIDIGIPEDYLRASKELPEKISK